MAWGQGDKVLFDFESGTFQGWTLEGGKPFGDRPFRASTEVPKCRQDRSFRGWQGHYMVIAGDTRHTQAPAGKITSSEFAITHSYLRFYLGGEAHPRVRVALLVGGKEVRTAFGNNSYDMRLRGWNIKEFHNRSGRIVIEDFADVPSLLRVDHFHLSETLPPAIGAFEESLQESSVLRPGEWKLVFDPGPGKFVAHASIVRGLDGRWHMYAQIAVHQDRAKPEIQK